MRCVRVAWCKHACSQCNARPSTEGPDKQSAVADQDAVAVGIVVVGAVAVAAPVAESGVVVPSGIALRAACTRLRQIDQRRPAFEAGIPVGVEPVAPRPYLSLIHISEPTRL